MPTACSKRETKRFESKKGKSELSPADDQQARHVDTLLQARYTPNGYFYPRLPMTNKPGGEIQVPRNLSCVICKGFQVPRNLRRFVGARLY